MGWCLVCGRKLKKSSGPIGPTCLKKFQTHNIRVQNVPSDEAIQALEENDLFEEDEGEQRQDQKAVKGASGEGATAQTGCYSQKSYSKKTFDQK